MSIPLADDFADYPPLKDKDGLIIVQRFIIITDLVMIAFCPSNKAVFLSEIPNFCDTT